MTEAQKRMMAAQGVKSLSKPKDDRISDVENALMELAELLDSAISEHENALVELAEIVAGMEE